jgi:hypothetical protein
MKNNNILSALALSFSVLVFAGTIIFSASCKKNKDSDVIITVMDGTQNVPVASATVHIYPPPSQPPPSGSSNLSGQDQTSITDAAGTVSFTFKLPAILQADVTPPPLSGLSPASALVKLEEGKQVSKTIKLY